MGFRSDKPVLGGYDPKILIQKPCEIFGGAKWFVKVPFINLHLAVGVWKIGCQSLDFWADATFDTCNFYLGFEIWMSKLHF